MILTTIFLGAGNSGKPRASGDDPGDYANAIAGIK